jgi:excisionase family DNA binding protein
MTTGVTFSVVGGSSMRPRSDESEFEVMVPEEIAKFLRVSLATVEEEIRSGRLPALQIGSDWRILRKDFDQFLRGGRVIGSKPKTPTGSAPQITFTQTAPFSYVWPNRKQRDYDVAYEGMAGGKRIKIGFGWSVADPERRKAVVFADGRPMVTFKAADDFARSGLMLSIIKTDDRKHLRPGDPVPDEYSGFHLEPYRTYISERHTSKNMAVACDKDDLQTMAAHALIRAAQIEERKAE